MQWQDVRVIIASVRKGKKKKTTKKSTKKKK